MSSVPLAEPRPLRNRPDVAQRSTISLSCRIVLWLANFVRTPVARGQLQLVLAISLITVAPLLFIAPIALKQPGPITRDRFIFAIWPSLLALATTTFAWQTTRHLSESASQFTSILKDGHSCDALHAWQKFFRTWPQVLMAFAIGGFGAIGSFVRVRQLGLGLVPSMLVAFSVLMPGFMGGLGFYVGAFSPTLPSAFSRCEFNLHPFSPATTPEIREIAWSHGRIVFKGMIVGVVLSSPLLYLVSRHTATSLRFLFVIAIVPAWLVVFWVFGSVHYHLYKLISKTKMRTQLHLHVLIKRAYEKLDQPKGNELERLQQLLELDKLVHSSPRFALDTRVVLQAISSLIAAVIPVALESLIRRF